VIPLLGATVSLAVLALLAVAGSAGDIALAVVVVLMVVMTAAGWAELVDLPHRRGTAVVITLSGVAAVGVALVSETSARPLAPFAAVLALSVLGAFGHELARRDGRSRLVESVTGTLAGQVVAVLGAGWVLLPRTGLALSGLVVATVAAGAARAAGSLPFPPRVTGWVAVAAAAIGGGAAAAFVDPVRPLRGGIVGLAVGATVAALDRLLLDRPVRQVSIGLLAAAVAPVAVAGTVAYAAVRLVAG
jgi:hypothetical protein